MAPTTNVYEDPMNAKARCNADPPIALSNTYSSHQKQENNHLPGIWLPLFFSLIFLCQSNPTIAGTKGGGKIIITITVTAADDGKTINVRRGDVIQIELEEMGTAGYTWHFDAMNHKYLDLLSTETKGLSKEKTGGPVLGIWRLKTKKSGRTGIKMSNYRKWEGKGKCINRFSVNLSIE